MTPALRLRAQLVAAAASLLAVFAATAVFQGIYGDPAYQLKAVQQKLAGESPSINIRVSPAPDDLSRDMQEWIAWWTPGTQIAVYPFMRAGLSLGRSVRAVAAITLIVGAVGWATWFSFFDLPAGMLLALSALFPFIRYASNGLFLYSAESLVFAAGPWMLILTMKCLSAERAKARGYVSHGVLGLALGAAYWLKDSLAFVALGATVALAIAAWRRGGDRVGSLARCAATGIGAAIPFITLVALNHRYGPLANKVTSALSLKLPGVPTLLDALALPVLQMADAFAMWDYLLMHPSHPVIQNAIWISVIAAPGGVLLWWLMLRRPAVTSPAASLARSVLVCSLASIATIWTISAAVDHKPRHVASAAFAALPLAIAEARRRWSGLSAVTRSTLLAAGAGYLCIPLAYGVVSVAAKVARFPPHYRPGPADIYNPLLSETDIASVRGRLLSHTTHAAIWYVPDPVSALDLPGRLITTTADFEPLAELKAARYVSSRAVEVRALLTEKFARDGKADAIRASLQHAGPWKMESIPSSDYQLWTANLKEK
jgi:hypothetical protein